MTTAKPRFEILLRERDFIAIEKPPGFHVHQPEFPRRRVPKEVTCLPNLRDQIGEYVFPVHRLDVATDGVLIFALNKEAAGNLCRQFEAGKINKTYFAVVRGWSDDEGVADHALESDSSGDMLSARTRYRTCARVELPYAVGKRHASARYSLVEAWPETGRYHQVRRHMARLSHPLVGDAMHGDSHHNRFFRETLGLGGLWLKAKKIEFAHPLTGAPIMIESTWSERWQRMFASVGFPIP